MTAADEGEPVGAVQLDLGAEEGAARLRLPAREAGVAVARQFVVGMVAVLHVDGRVCEDLKLAATEACTNAVVHAYPNGDSGPVELALEARGDDLLLTVADRGRGPPDEDDLAQQDGYGLALIEAVCDELELGRGDGGGTVVEMRFRHARATPAEPLDAVHSPVLRRVVAMVAAHAGFTMDRLSDAVLVAETLTAHTPAHSTDGVVRLAVEQERHELVLRVGPLRRAGAGALLRATRLPAYGSVIEHLADAVTEEHAGLAEHLVVHLRPRP